MTATPLDLAVALVTAHVLADFGLQGAGWAEWKERSLAGLVLHVLLYGVLTWLLLPAWSTPLLALVAGLTAAHGLIDLWKGRSWPPVVGRGPLARLLLDQGAHLLTLVVALSVAARLGPEPLWLEPWSRLHELVGLGDDARWIPRGLVLVSAYVLAVTGGSVTVRALLEPYAPALPSDEELSLGRVIGYLERLILVTLLLLGQYAAMAVIVAAKSLIRIPSVGAPAEGAPAEAGLSEGDDRGTGRRGNRRARGRGERITTEYFLIGTLGSIAVAIAIGLAARWALLAL
jgi:hypothetical protein